MLIEESLEPRQVGRINVIIAVAAPSMPSSTTRKSTVRLPRGAVAPHCTEPLEVKAYRIGACLPGVLLGVVPALIGIISGSGELLLWGLLFTLAARGDMLVVWLIRHVPAEQLIEDHPHCAGCYVIDRG